jgi:cytochrome P450
MTGTLAERPAFPMARGRCPYDPPPEVTALREERPVGRVTLYDGSSAWLFTRHADVRALLADRRFSSDIRRPGFPLTSPGRKGRVLDNPTFITLDDPEHNRLRRMLISEFTVRRTESLRAMVTEVVHDLLEKMAAGPQPADLVTSFTLPLPSLVICRMLGVPYADHDYFQQLSAKLLTTSSAPEEVLASITELCSYLADVIRKRMSEPDDGMISRVLVPRVEAGDLTLDEAASMARLLLVAGHETTANQLALGTMVLLDNPEQAAELRESDDPAVVDSAVEELLRLLTIVHQARGRVATEDVEIGGVLVRAGEGVLASNEAANRDPDAFPDPDQLDIHRGEKHHVAFGFGVHQCLGQPLARLELRIAYPALLRRFPGLAVAKPVEELAFRGDKFVYGVHHLPVTW